MAKFDELVEKIKATEFDMDEFKENKLANLIKRKQAEEIIEEVEEERKVKIWVILLAIVGVIAIGCVVGYLIYKKNKPDYLDDFDDDFDAEDEDFFDED